MMKVPVPHDPSLRRLSSARRAIEREQLRMGLFASSVRTETPSERIERMDAAYQESVRRLRACECRAWLHGREALRRLSLTEPERARRLREQWNHSRLPGQAAYFCDFLQSNGVGLDFTPGPIVSAGGAGFQSAAPGGPRSDFQHVRGYRERGE
jgi:hypothetical protein